MITNQFSRLLTAILLITSSIAYCQMDINGQTYYGNEWIDYSKKYYKVKVGKDGLYRISGEALKKAGIELNDTKHEDIQVWNFGKEIPIYTSSVGLIKEDDYIEFYGQKHTIGLDSFMYKDWRNEMHNSHYSVINDTCAYYITLNKGKSNKRYNVISPDYNNNTLVSPQGFMYTEEIIYGDSWYKPLAENQAVKYSNYVKGEGFGFGFKNDQGYTISSKNRIDIGQSAKLTLRIANNGVEINRKEILFNGNIIAQLNNTPKVTDEIIEVTYTIPYLDLKDENLVQIINRGIEDKHSLAYLSLTYSRSTDVSLMNFLTLASTNSFYYEFTASDKVARVYDISSGTIYKTKDLQNNNFGILHSATNNKNLVFQSKPELLLNVESVTFIDLRKEAPNYLIISNKKLYQSEGGNIDYLLQYADYRSSTEGGSFKVYTLFADQIYDQFGYGIDHHAYAFKNMTHYLKEEWPQLEYVFMIGKGRVYREVRTKAQLEKQVNKSFYIPTYGDSPSDNLLFSTGDSPKPHFAIGRLAVETMEEIGYYLDKVKVHDAAVNLPQDQDKLWLKRIMHMGGGNVEREGETKDIKRYLQNMEKEITTNAFGGKVISFYKNANVDIQVANLTEILETINNGISILTFFGHAAVGNFDFDLDNPANYKNEGKLPFLFSLGCYSGNICSDSKGIGERFVLTPKVGAIGFVAAAGTAYLGTQGIYGEEFYKDLGGKYYNFNIGKILQGIHADNEFNLGTDVRTLHQQLTLHADPAIRIHAFDKPDYTVDYNTISINPKIVLQSDESFNLSFDVNNLGKNNTDSIVIQINHVLPNGDTFFNQKLKVSAVGYSKKISVDIQVPKLNSVGINKIYIFSESEEKIDELSESNNKLVSTNSQLGYEFLIVSEGIKPIYPSEFSIVHDKDVRLLASGTNLFQKSNNYYFEIDTTEEFNSQALKSAIVTNQFSLIEWKPNFEFSEGIVYYWRIASEPKNNGSKVWQNSSFIYLPNDSDGWNHSHYFQWKKDTTINIEFNRNSTMQFDNRERTVKVRSEVFRNEDIPFTIVDGSKWGALTAFNGDRDIIQIQVWTPTGLFLNENGTAYNSQMWDANACFAFDPKTIESRIGINSLLQAIPDKSIVFINFYFSNINSDYKLDDWANDSLSLGFNLFSTFEKYGAIKIRKLVSLGLRPYIFHFQKGEGSIEEVIGTNILDQISVTGKVKPNFPSGTITSTRIGPALKWDNIEWKNSNIEVQDSSFVEVFFSNSPKDIPILYKKIVQSGLTDLSEIDAQAYPYLVLRYTAIDALNRSAPNLDYWRVHYLPLPDIAIIANEKLIFKNSTLDEGDTFEFRAQLKNISSAYIKDSISILYTFANSLNEKIYVSQKVKPLKADEASDISVTLATKGLKKEYQFLVEANKDDKIIELHKFNNIGVNTFNIKYDSINPNLTVTFDGVRILDGDIVSSKPEIRVLLNDNNKFLRLERPDLFKIRLKKGTTINSPIVDIDLNSPQITFVKSTDISNEAYINYKPELEDGDYTLLINAKDESNNISGNVEYSVTFKVVSKKSISNVYNFPNPFSSSTRFVFTLTGQVPEFLKIQIMTTTGKVVREITKVQLGNIHIGNNITDYAWDGTDEFGTKLANGVYFYRLVKSNSATYEKSDIDKDNNIAFKEGFGKLVLLR